MIFDVSDYAFSQWIKVKAKGGNFQNSCLKKVSTFLVFFSTVPVEGPCGHAVSITFFLLFFTFIVGVLITYLTIGTVFENR